MSKEYITFINPQGKTKEYTREQVSEMMIRQAHEVKPRIADAYEQKEIDKYSYRPVVEGIEIQYK